MMARELTAVPGTEFVEAEAADIRLERGGAAGVDDLDAERAGAGERARGVVGDRGRAFLRIQQPDQVILVAQHREDRLVDERDRRKLQLRLQGDVRRDRGLDDGRVTHRRIETADFVADRRRIEIAALSQLRQQQPRRVHVGPGDVGVDVDAAREHDAIGDVVLGVGPSRRIGRCDNARILDPEIADLIASVRRIDDAPALEPGQHDAGAVIAAPMRVRISAVRGTFAGEPARAKASAPVAGSNSEPS